MKSKDITNKLTEWRDPMDMMNRGRMGPEMGGGGGAGGYAGGRNPFSGMFGGKAKPAQPSTTPQSARELAPELLRTPAQVKPSKTKGPEEPIVKRETPPELTRPDVQVSRQPAVQRKAEADKATKDVATKDRTSQPRYTMDPKTGKPVPANVQAQLQQKLQGKGFKEPEPGSVSGFRPKSDRGSSKKEPAKAEPAKAEPAKVEPAKAEPAAQAPAPQRTLGGSEVRPGLKYNTKTGKWEKDPNYSGSTLPSARNTPVKQEKSDKKSAATSVGLHAALLAALANMSPEEKRAAAEKYKTAPQGDSDKPMTVNLIDPGSQKASDAAATNQPSTSQPSTSTAITQPSADSSEERSLPPVVVTAEPDKPKPEKKQPEKIVVPDRKAEEPKKGPEVMTTTEPSTWETDFAKELERAEADKADAEQSAKTTQAVPKPEEDEEDVLEKLRKLLGLDKNAEQQAKTEPAKEPDTEKPKTSTDVEIKPDPNFVYSPPTDVTPAPEVQTQRQAKKDTEDAANAEKSKDKSGKADAEKGDDTKKGDEPKSFPKYKKDEKNELPKDTEKKGDDETTRKTDSAVDRGPAAQGRDDAINWAPPPPERKYEPDDRATRLRDKLKQQMNRDDDVDFIDRKRMAPVKESIDHIVGLSNITKKEIVESTMNLDMKTMLALISEASKMTDIKGKKHTGKYGKEFDTDEEGEAKDKKAEPAEKKGRGRPKKDSNVEAGKYKGADDAAKHLIGGKAPKGKSNLPSKKHSLKDWVEHTEKTLVESEQIEEKAVSKAQQKFMGMVHAAQKGKKPASKEVAKVAKTMGKKDAKDFASTKHKGLPEKVKEALKGGQKNLDVAEPKGKLDAKDFAQLRAKKGMKKKVKEGINFAEMMKETQMSIEEMLEGLQQEIAEFKATGQMGDKLRDALDVHRYSGKDKLMGEAPMMAQPMVEEPVEESPFTYAARQAKASGEDSFKLGGETFPVKESQEEVEESGLQAYLGNKKYGKEGMNALRNAGRDGASKEKMAKLRAKYDKMDEGSIEKSGPNDLTGTWSSETKKGKPDVPPPVPMDPVYPDAKDINKPEPKPIPKKSMKESFDFSLWDNQLEKMLTESLTISTTQGDHGGEDSVSITASGEKAAEIMTLLRNAGVDSMGGSVGIGEPVEPEQMLSAYGVPMSSEEEAPNSGMDDMLSLMKKLTGMGSDESDSEEIEFDAIEPENNDQDSEDYEEEGEEESDSEEDSEESSDEDSEENSDDEEDSEEEVDESYGQTDEGNKFTGNLAKARAAGKEEADLDGDGDMEKVHEGQGMCQECGMSEGQCSHSRMDEADSPFQNENLESARPIEEELANGDDDASMQDIKFLIKTLAGGLNREKRDQTTLPHTAVKVTESKEMLNEWKKLSGIK